MKKITVLVLCLVGILIVSCGNNSANTKNSNINVQISNSTSSWEHIATIKDGNYKQRGPAAAYLDINGVVGNVYVKQIGGEMHYKIALSKGVQVAIYENPNYGGGDYDRYDNYRYCYDNENTTYFINF